MAADGRDLGHGFAWRSSAPRLVGGEDRDVEGGECPHRLAVRPGKTISRRAVGVALGGTDLMGDHARERLVTGGAHRLGRGESPASEHPQIVEP